MHDHGHHALSPEFRETIDLWVSDFLDRPAASEPAGRVGQDAQNVLSQFMEGACHGGCAPADIGSSEATHALLDHVSGMGLAVARASAVPDLVAAFLGDLEDVGRLADGHLIAASVRASGTAFRDRAAGRGPDLTRQAAKIGRNDPCPCGSGRKYKQCCLGRPLGG